MNSSPDPPILQSPAANPQPPTLVLIDDDPEVLRATERILVKAGYHVITGENAKEAVDLTRRHLPAMLLLDVMLPDGNGVEIAQGLKSDPSLVGVFVVLLSGLKTSGEDQAAGLATGLADGYIARPFSKPEFLARVDALLRLRTAQEALREALLEKETLLREQRRAADELRRLARAVEQSPTSIVITDRAGNIEYVNAYFEQVTGYTKAEARGKNPRILKSGATPSETYIDMWRAISQGGEWRGELCNRRKNGELFWEYAAISGLKDESGEVSHFIAVKDDITNRRQAEDALRRSEARHRAITQSAYDAIVTADSEGRIVGWNRGATLTFGYEESEALGRPLTLLIPERHHLGHLAGMARARRGDELYLLGQRLELHGLRKDGVEFPLEITLSRWEGPDGWFVTGILGDITERKRAEERQVSLISELDEARLAAERAAQAKGEFLANMSHEIRTPMNGVIGMTGLLLDTKLSPEQREFAETIRTSAEALLTIINDILDFSKIESGKLDLEILDFDLQMEMESVVELLAGPAQAKGIELVSSLRPGTPSRLRGDAGRLRQILTNLAGNAIKFTAQGEVVVSVTPAAEDATHSSLRFEVRDTGPGIPRETQARLFKAFSQADASTTRKFGGTGLGLAISRQLVELMGGEIGVTSEVGKGSTFWFTLRLEKQPKEAEAAVEYRDLGGARVLVVDDNATNRQITGHQLRSWKVYERAAASGPEALDILRDAEADGAPYDVALLDMQMPGMDGMMLARAMEREPALAVTRRSIMTSLGQRPSDAELHEAGVDAYLAKPIRQSRLLDCLSRVLTRGGRDASSRTTGWLVRRSTLLAPESAAGARNIRILLADDNRINQKVAMGQLRRLGHTADTVVNGLEVLDALTQKPYDVVLMDCQMPEMDGYDATRAIRRREAEAAARGEPGPRVHVIAMTAHAMEGDREKCLAAGMDDYVSKPVRTEALRAALDRWQPAPAGSANPLAPARTEKSAAAAEECPVDMARLGEMADHDPAATRELVDMYLREADEVMGALRASVQSGPAAETERLAHKLGGSSATCGMAGIVPPLRELERSGIAGHWPENEQLLQEADRQLERIRAFLAVEIPRP